MKIDVSVYKANLPFVKILLDRHVDLPSIKVVSLVTQATGCPLVVSAYLVAAYVGMTDELQAFIHRISEFYNYEEITGGDILKELVKEQING